MDIFIRNIADHTSPNSLKKFLREKLKTFGINTFDCFKLPRRGCAILTVPDEAKGLQFIEFYSSPRNILRLTRPIYVSRGQKTPDPFLVKALEKRERDLGSGSLNLSNQPKRREGKFAIVSLECGVWDYKVEDLIFKSHFSDRQDGVLMFGDKALTISSPPVNWENDSPTTRIDIQYAGVNSMATGHHREPAITLTLERAPKVYRLEKNKVKNLLMKSIGQPQNQQHKKPVRILGINEAHGSVLAYCLVYRIRLRSALDFTEFLNFMKSHKKGNLPKNIRWPYKIYQSRKSFPEKMDSFSLLLEQFTSFDFGLKFQLQRMVHNGFLLPGTVGKLLPHVQKIVIEFGTVVATQAVESLITFRQIPFAGPATRSSDLMESTIVKLLHGNVEAVIREPPMSYTLVKLHPNMALVHRVNVKPSGIYLAGPELESKNRVLRIYAKQTAECFIRVVFSDEDERSVRFDNAGSMEVIHTGFKEFLDTGMFVAGRKFEFLGFSNSSLREQGCWFMSPVVENGQSLSAREVIKKLGDFTFIKSPAKCAARIGQAFTDTPLGAMQISLRDVEEIPDVKRSDRVFSDGCGTVSQALMEELWLKMFKHTKPSLVQFRYAGAKGMISLDSTLEGNRLRLRPSQHKFVAPHTDLEICGSGSRPLHFYLNRQIIKILEDLGVKAIYFHELQDEAVRKLRMTTENSINASSFLEHNSIGKAANLPWFILNLDYIGLSYLQDSFLRQVVEHTVLSQLRMLKHKARIPVEKGLTLYGVMDETDTLLENEIFCCTDKFVVEGSVAITRSPALHPGDVQIAMAVDVPSESPLKKLHNCVVFSQRGERDLPSKLSGGDLDGDLFNIIYDEHLQPMKTYEPADYPRVDPIDIGRQVRVKDMTDFFVEFMANDQLARIASLHMQIADSHSQGTMSRDCLDLAGLHSTAVDFQKTGIPVDMARCPRYRPYKPDFMAPGPRVKISPGLSTFADDEGIDPSDDEDNPDNSIDPNSNYKQGRYYESEKVLGQLYRAIDEKAFLREIERQASGISVLWGTGVMQQLYEYCKKQTSGIGYMHLCGEARDIRFDYEELVADMQNTNSDSRHHLITEVEVFTGAILGNEEGAFPSKRVVEASKSMKEHFDEGVTYILQRILHASEDDSENEYEVPGDEALERSMACLHVALEDREGEKVPLSFRYIAGMACLREVLVFARSHGMASALSRLAI